MKNLLAIDIGNSHVKFGFFRDDELVERLSCRLSEIKDFTRETVRRLMTAEDGAVAVASVVPKAEAELTAALAEVFEGGRVIWVRPELQHVLTGVDRTMGADRLCDAVAAWKIYGKGKKAVAIVGMGTATTMLVVSGKGHVMGGYIAPGLGLTLTSMHEQTALLPLLEMTGQTTALGHDTDSHMRNGVFVGHCGLVRHWLKVARKEVRRAARQENGKENGQESGKESDKASKNAAKKMVRVATGGWSEAVTVAFPEGKVFDFVDQDLTLKGILLLAKSLGQESSDGR